jgi:4-hydroxybenzoate polyprenyltransferase
MTPYMLVRYPNSSQLPLVHLMHNYCQDKADDAKAGVKSTALLFGSWIKPILSMFALFFIFQLAVSGYLNGNGPAYFLVSVAGALVHFIWQLTTLNVDEPSDCWRKFQVCKVSCPTYFEGFDEQSKANHSLGYVIWGGMLIDYYLRVAK